MRKAFFWAALILLLVVISQVMVNDKETAPVDVGPPADEGCERFVELVSASDLAEELGRTEAWVLASYRINLWSSPTSRGKGRAVGKMLPGCRARVLDYQRGDYRVESPLDGSIGWINEVQVYREVWQNPRTKRLCEGGGRMVVISCPDGTTYVGNRPDRACSD